MNSDTPIFCQPRWKPIGQYRTCGLPIFPILPLMKRIPYPPPIYTKKSIINNKTTGNKDNL